MVLIYFSRKWTVTAILKNITHHSSLSLRPVHIKVFSSACRRTQFNEHQISRLCDVWLCWKWKSVKLVVFSSHISSFNLISHCKFWDVWCSLNRGRRHADKKSLILTGLYARSFKFIWIPLYKGASLHFCWATFFLT